MKFGVFYELQRPRPWGPDGEEKLVREALEQIELADRLGFDSVWEVEHHFLEEYSHSSAPEVFLAAASQRTKRIRLGHGIVQLPLGFNHPARVAERIGMLDLVSGGRVEFGTGQGSSQAELGGFGVDRDLKHDQWEEALDAIIRMMTEEPFTGHDGRFFSMPPRNVIPKPKQKPHPPLWVACSRRDTILTAARKGLGALSFSFVEPEAAKAWVDDYYRIIAGPECVPAGLAINPQVAVVLPFMCHQDEQTAIDRGIDGGQFFGFSLAYYYVFGKHQPGVSNIWDMFVKQRKDYGFARELIRADDRPLGIKLLEEGLGSFRGSVGTPAQLIELLSRYERAGVDLVIFAAQAGNNRHEHICESLELFSKAVMPHFAEKEEAHQAEKRTRLAGAAERALARRAPSRAMNSEYVITPQGESGPVGTVRVYPQVSPAVPAHAAASNGAGSAVLGWLVRDRSDSQIERMMPLLAPVIFKGMARAFKPQLSRGFSGEIQYELRSNGKSRKWVVQIADGKAVAKRGSAANPSVTLRMSEPTFARISAGMIPSMAAMLEGKVEAEGDLNLLARLGEMFGGPSGF
jgi:alkanesulfonate monooxygenase SsuD/methylene tetrahydromethanopterin reductase-like flavin-dependent oxidoreductase (luciferase family)/putative sterol carrier protein